MFLLGDHSLDQIVFGWMLGAWLAVSYFFLMRHHIHKHVISLMNGRESSSAKVLCIVAMAVWLLAMLVIFITFLIVRTMSIN